MKTDPNIRIAPENPINSANFFDVIFKRYNIKRSTSESMIASQWRDIVGPELAEISKFGSLKNGILTVFCDNGSQATLFRMNKSEVIKNIQSVFPELVINKVNIRVKVA